MQAGEIFKNYTKMRQELVVLEYKLQCFQGISCEDVIEGMNYSRPQGDRVQEGGVSDKTGKIAVNYRKVADRLDDEYFDSLFRRCQYLKEELDFFDFAVGRLSGRLPEFIKDMVVEGMAWTDLMEKYRVSYSTVGRYRKKAEREMNRLYGFRDRLDMEYMLS